MARTKMKVKVVEVIMTDSVEGKLISEQLYVGENAEPIIEK